MLQNNRILDEVILSDQRCVLATVIKVEGSTYRKEGVTMLIKEDGSRIGMLSGGCIENDLLARADERIQEGTSRRLFYDMRNEDDLTWGRGTGCNGLIHVLLEPVHPRMREHLGMVKKCIDQGIAVTAIKNLNGEPVATDYLFIPNNNQAAAFGNWNGALPDEASLRGEAMGLHKSGIRYIEDLNAEVFIHTYKPSRRLILFGAGEDARPLAALAANTGFSVVVADWRSDLCSEAHFPSADLLWVGFPSEVQQEFNFTSEDSVVIMTHDFQRDKELLQFLMRLHLTYLGILGPRDRTSRLLDGCAIPDWVHSPVGLPIGADGPEEIAISIIADLIRIRGIHS